MAVALCAIAISAISLFIAIDNSRTERKLVAASSWPFLVSGKEVDGLVHGSRLVLLKVANSGVGPARVQSVSVRVNGKSVRSSAELLAACCGMPASTDIDGRIRLGLLDENSIVGVMPARQEVRERPGNAALWSAL